MSAVLKQIQVTLQNFLMNPRCEPEGLIVETERMTRSTRLGIYANAYRARMLEAMAADYKALKIYLGDDGFESLILAYVDAHPSHYFSIRWVGANLLDFIRTTAPYSDHIDLYELARFEWALCHAFDAVNRPPLRAEALAQLSAEKWSELTLPFSPSLQVLALHTNAPQLWQALNAEQTPPSVKSEAATQGWLIWRKQLKLMFRPASAIELVALDHFRAGETFGAVCAVLAAHVPEAEVPARAVQLLQQWLQDELVVRDNEPIASPSSIAAL